MKWVPRDSTLSENLEGPRDTLPDTDPPNEAGRVLPAVRCRGSRAASVHASGRRRALRTASQDGFGHAARDPSVHADSAVYIVVGDRKTPAAIERRSHGYSSAASATCSLQQASPVGSQWCNDDTFPAPRHRLQTLEHRFEHECGIEVRSHPMARKNDHRGIGAGSAEQISESAVERPYTAFTGSPTARASDAAWNGCSFVQRPTRCPTQWTLREDSEKEISLLASRWRQIAVCARCAL